MDIVGIVASLKDCPCGRSHTVDIRAVEIGRGMVRRAGEILKQADFGERLLVVFDRNSHRVTEGIEDSLTAAGFSLKTLIYDNMQYARAEYVTQIEALCRDMDGVLTVGTGSVNDICRAAAHRQGKPLAIFGTAPSMDGFASDGAPIIANQFKTTWQATQPRVIMADTEVLANAPDYLKSAGFGDMMAKYIGLFEWKLVHELTGEYYCPAVADLTKQAVEKLVAMADRVQDNDPEVAGAIMEALVLSGMAMKLALSSRPASGAEHTISHYIGLKKLDAGLFPEYHGRKVGVATVLINRIYHNLADRVEVIDPHSVTTDWAALETAYTPLQMEEVRKINSPDVSAVVDPQKLRDMWPHIRQMIYDMLPPDELLCDILRRAGAPISPDEIHVEADLLEKALRFHPFMRRRVMLSHMMLMMGQDIMDFLS